MKLDADVEKNVPIPTDRLKGKVKKLMSLEVGDSFFVAGVGPNKRNWISSAKQLQYRRGDVAFCYRSVEGGIRIWRTK